MTFVAAPARLSTASATFEQDFAQRLHWSAEQDAAIEQRVADILADVRQRGDAAVLDYTARFDQLQAADMATLELTQAELKAAYDSLPAVQQGALTAAAARVRSYHEAQKKASGESWSYRDADGTLLGQKVTPLDRVGIYVPGGKAAYPSSVLMNAIPAHVAGVGEIIMVVPTPRGEKNPLVLAAAYVAGVTRAFTIGGAQAVAALAYGTRSVPRVDKIVGPGNVYVATAKRLCYGLGLAAIDMVAGPSEILVIADGGSNPAHVAADLLSQAEHDRLSSAWLVTPDAALAQAVREEVERRLATLPRAEIARASIEHNGRIIVVDSLQTAARLSNDIAPEHLELCVDDPFGLLPLIRSAGSVFLGRNCPEPLGDYLAGPNHTLPTGGTARYSSQLGVDDFCKRSSFLYYTAEALADAADDVRRFAMSEGLQAHAQAVSARLE